ncbi:MAG: flagellin [Micavibrio sp.]|nr:flagellin [Micavibrio sp.]|tara:strand:- start:1069 stop:1890 length:822 start_codon:yes stop_codon:yes gene_type:complete
MGAVIATNTAANTALVYLNKNIDQQSSSLAKISSGSRIVTASDDAAGLAVGTGLRADAAILKQAAVNTANSRAVLNVADGGLAQISNILERQAVLAAQSASGTVDDNARGFIDAEFQALQNEINAIESAVTFNGAALLDGTFNENTLVGVNAADLIALDLSGINVDTTSLGSNAAAVGTNANAVTAIGLVNTAIDTVVGYRADVGALQSRFGFRGDVVAVAVDNTEDAASAILDVNIAEEQTNLTNKQVLTEAAIAGLSQANQLTQSLLSLIQ